MFDGAENYVWVNSFWEWMGGERTRKDALFILKWFFGSFLKHSQERGWGRPFSQRRANIAFNLRSSVLLLPATFSRKGNANTRIRLLIFFLYICHFHHLSSHLMSSPDLLLRLDVSPPPLNRIWFFMMKISPDVHKINMFLLLFLPFSFWPRKNKYFYSGWMSTFNISILL